MLHFPAIRIEWLQLAILGWLLKPKRSAKFPEAFDSKSTARLTERAQGKSCGEVEDNSDSLIGISTAMHEGYTLTALTAVAIAQRYLLTCCGFQTPSLVCLRLDT